MPISLRENIARRVDTPDSESVLMGRAELLARKDRDLLEAVLVRGQPASSLARLMDVSASQVRKRVYRLCRRLNSREFLTAARMLRFLPGEERELARRHFCEGCSQRDLAEQTGRSLHSVRRTLDRVRAKISALAAIQQGGRREEGRRSVER
jgi:DNA-directed RNA polymerase specialized sigma24 family protein